VRQQEHTTHQQKQQEWEQQQQEWEQQQQEWEQQEIKKAQAVFARFPLENSFLEIPTQSGSDYLSTGLVQTIDRVRCPIPEDSDACEVTLCVRNVGSGFLIGSNLVLIAGHVIFSHESQYHFRFKGRDYVSPKI